MAWSFYDSTGQVLQGVLAGAIDSGEIASGAIDLAHMSVNSIDSDQYVDGSIDLAHMSANSIDSTQYVDGSIDLAHMSANSVDSAQYVDGSIDLAHMSVNSIDSNQYVDGSIDGVHIADNAVTFAKMDNTAKERVIQMVVIDFATALTTGNGKFYFHVPSTLNGFNIVDVHAEVITVATGSTIIIDLYNVTHSADILSTNLTIDASESGSDTAAAAAVISGSEDDLATNDVIRVDIDQIGSSNTGVGLIVTLICRLP